MPNATTRNDIGGPQVTTNLRRERGERNGTTRRQRERREHKNREKKQRKAGTISHEEAHNPVKK